MANQILVPSLGESITEATVSKWLKEVGEKVDVDEPLVELETDKVNVEVPSPLKGTLSSIKFKEGDTVEVGALLGVVKEDSDKPIVLGAEPVLVTGVISEGDFIVTSDKRGHGKKGLSNNMFGKVIGQALESGEGDSYVIKAMVRKL